MGTAYTESIAFTGASTTGVPINCDAAYQLTPQGEPLMTRTADMTHAEQVTRMHRFHPISPESVRKTEHE